MEDLPRLKEYIDATVAEEPRERTFAGYDTIHHHRHTLTLHPSSLQRDSNGKFSDDDLARILYKATKDPAGAFGGRRTPGVMRLVEIMGIKQARTWAVCTMNEFRKFLGLKGTLFLHFNASLTYSSIEIKNSRPLKNGILTRRLRYVPFP